MSAKRDNWSAYYSRVRNRTHSQNVQRAVDSVRSDRKVAVDCGCGAGSDAQFLIGKGYRVHAFDINPESVDLCRARVGNDSDSSVKLASFESFTYPSADLVVANASLFFCPPGAFAEVWTCIRSCLAPGGVFCGDFLGPDDSWAHQGSESRLHFTEAEVMGLFTDFDILHWSERNEYGSTRSGTPKHWHIYSIIARRKNLPLDVPEPLP